MDREPDQRPHRAALTTNPLTVHTLRNRLGDQVELLALGARIRSLTLNLESGPRNVVLGYASLDDYRSDRFYMGATIGRYANRIGHARFDLDGASFTLLPNEGPHHLHGGPSGFDTRIWRVLDHSKTEHAAAIRFGLVSSNGDQGYPGTLSASVEYQLDDQRELRIRYRATTDRPTPVSLTSHAYFNLDDEGTTIHRHRLRIRADSYLATDAANIPTGEILDLAGGPLDLRRPRPLGDLMDSSNPEISEHLGPDVCYVLTGQQPAAILSNRPGDLTLLVSTSYPGLQLYAGQYLDAQFDSCSGLCLEPQHFPDSPNHVGFPQAFLRPGARLDEWIRLAFRAG